jgi:hypothetical protein
MAYRVPHPTARIPGRMYGKKASERVRLAIQQGWKCFYCRSPLMVPASSFTTDHYLPRALGGSDKKWNKVASCRPCNEAKADALPWPLAVVILHAHGKLGTRPPKRPMPDRTSIPPTSDRPIPKPAPIKSTASRIPPRGARAARWLMRKNLSAQQNWHCGSCGKFIHKDPAKLSLHTHPDRGPIAVCSKCSPILLQKAQGTYLPPKEKKEREAEKRRMRRREKYSLRERGQPDAEHTSQFGEVARKKLSSCLKRWGGRCYMCNEPVALNDDIQRYAVIRPDVMRSIGLNPEAGRVVSHRSCLPPVRTTPMLWCVALTVIAWHNNESSPA